MPTSDLQLTAVTCFFISAKNIMIEPFTLPNVIESMCYNKFTCEEFLQKERDIRHYCNYENESANLIDFTSLFIKEIKYKFCEYQDKEKKYRTMKISKSTIDFVRELEILSYEFSKIVLADGMTKRYLTSYLSASVLLAAESILLGKVVDDKNHKMVVDLTHV